MSLKIEKLDRLKAKIAAMPAAIRVEIRAALAASAGDISEQAKRFVPVGRTGRLRASIGYTFGDYKPDNSSVRGVSAGRGGHDLAVTIHAGDRRAWYAALVEFGARPHKILPKTKGGQLRIRGKFIDAVDHPGAPAQPFFYPAFRLGKKKAKSKIARAVNKAVKKVASK